MTCYQACFPPSSMSACVKWAKDEVEAFNAVLARQLSGTAPEGQEWKECVEVAKDHARQLAEVGLDFRNLVAQAPQLLQASGSEPAVGLGLS